MVPENVKLTNVEPICIAYDNDVLIGEVYMKLTKKQLMEDGVHAVIASYDRDPTKREVRMWLKHPDVLKAAERDVTKHLEWQRLHGNLDNCEIPHNNLFRVFNKLLMPFGV